MFPLDGKPLAVTTRRKYGPIDQMSAMILGLTPVPVLTLVTDKDAALFTPSSLIMKFRSDKILFEPVREGKAIKIDAYKMDKHGELFVNDGKSYFAYMDGCCVPYSIKNRANGDYPSVSVYGTYGTNLLFFDSSTHSFLRCKALTGFGDYYGPSNNAKYIRLGSIVWDDEYPIEAITINPDDEEGSAFNPNNIDPSLQVRTIVTGGNGGNNAYAIASTQSGKDLTVFKFSSNTSTCAGLYTVSLPSEIDVETAKFAASYAYTADLLFVASGNKLYRIDLNRGLVTELYQYEADPSAQITCLKFKDAENEEDAPDSDESSPGNRNELSETDDKNGLNHEGETDDEKSSISSTDNSDLNDSCDREDDVLDGESDEVSRDEEYRKLPEEDRVSNSTDASDETAEHDRKVTEEQKMRLY